MNQEGVRRQCSPAAALAVLSSSHRSQSECSGQPNYTLSLLGSRPQENALFFCPLTVIQYTQFGDPTVASLFPKSESARPCTHIHICLGLHTYIHTYSDMYL